MGFGISSPTVRVLAVTARSPAVGLAVAGTKKNARWAGKRKVSMHTKSISPAWQSAVPAWLFDLVPNGRDVHELLSAGRTIPGTKTTVFDLTAAVMSRLSHVQADGTGPTAEVTRLTFQGTGFHIKVRCPFCGADHHHGGGAHVLPTFGHRVADCGLGSYSLLVGARS